MERKKSVSTALRFAIVFFVIKFVLDMVILCCEPLQRLLFMMFSGNILRDQKLSAVSIIFSAVMLIIALLPKSILAVYSLSKKDLQKQRGLITIILTAAFSLLSSVISAIGSPFIARITSLSETGLLSILSTPRAVTGLFSAAATIILYCCGAIELYNGTEKPVYPNNYSGNTDSENTLS
ncbi:hypothetical protein [Ruminococcus sp.]|uniref:hypothetical protein n=1 Tax=Ruminococcus sp. TaxID=41978 RepID=UPI0025E93E93|nr:hypothetical protein [Ruminococcus sp.]MCR4638216.1 hypothetical protein [Ruminococcus sp.]